MLFVSQLIFSLIVALIVSVVLNILLNKEGPRSGFFFFFLMLFLITYAGGLWVKPFGPTLFGVFWLPILVIGILSGLFYYQFVPRPPPQNREETLQMLEENEQRKKLEQVTFVTLDILFWMLIGLLCFLIIYRLVLGG